MSTVEQQKTQETKRAQMEEELKKITKQYEKILDKDYLKRIETNCENQKALMSKLEKENQAAQQKIKAIERKLDKTVKTDARKQPKMENEIKNLRTKLAYTTKKHDAEYNKLLEVSAKRKEIKEKETAAMEKETKIISRAKKEYGIDFENPAAMAKAAEEDELRERYATM